MNISGNNEWQGKWDCAEADLEELRMVETPSRALRFRIAGYLSPTISPKRIMTAHRGQLLHWLDESVEKKQAERIRELEEVAR